MAEAEPSEYLSKRLKTLLGVYVSETWWLCYEVKTACEAIFAETLTDVDYLKVSPAVNSLLVSVLMNAARIRRLIAAPVGNRQKHTGGSQEVGKHRLEMMSRLLEGLDLSELNNTKTRNTVEHLDEHLDRAVDQFLHLPPAKHYCAVYNMIVSRMAMLNALVSCRAPIAGDVFPLRVYASHEKALYNMQHSANIGRIYDEVCAILERLGQRGFVFADAPGGQVLFF